MEYLGPWSLAQLGTAGFEQGLSRIADLPTWYLILVRADVVALVIACGRDAFQRGIIRLTSRTLKAVNDLVVRAVVRLGLEDDAKLRVDTTVVQTDIHHPTDNTLLWDVVRVVTRLVGRLAKALELRRVIPPPYQIDLAM